MLFIGALHRVLERLPKDIHVQRIGRRDKEKS
jgi:hypothetical protein